MASKQNMGNGNINLHVGGDEANLRIGGGATVIKNYNFLNNKPQINGVELIGNKTFADLGLDVATTESNGLMSAEDKRRLLKTTECYELHITIVQQTETGVQFSIPQAEHTAIIQAYNNHDNFAILLNVTINSVNYSLVAFPCRIEQLFNFNAILFSVPSKDNGLAATSFFTVGLSVQYPSGVVVINTVDFELQNSLIGQKEDKSNKVQSISSESTASEYPSAKAVYDSIENLEPLIITATQREQPGAEDTYTLDNATFNDIAGAIYNGRNVFIRTMSDTFPYSNLIYDAESNRWAYVFGGTIASGGMIINKFFIVLNNPGNIGTLINNRETFVSTVNGQSGYVTIEDKIHTDTTANWNAQRDFVAENGHVYVYSDYQTIDGVPVPGFKVGDGSSYLIDMPFAGASDRASLEEHINNNVRHITAEEREFWNNKVTCFISSGDNETIVFTKNT